MNHEPWFMDLIAKRRQVRSGVVLAAVTILLYIPAIGSGFVWDDDKFLTENPHIHAADGLQRFWLSTEPPDYFPLTSSMLWFEWRLFGMDSPWGYHLINVLLHACSSILLWRVLRHLAIPGAWLAALVFAIHPVNVESVAWITERKNTLPMVFALLSTLLYLRSDKEGTAKDGKLNFALALGCFLLALLAKTSVVMLPVAFVVLAWWRTGSVTKRDILRTTPFFALSMILSLVTIWYQYNRAIGDFVVRDDPFLSRLAISGWSTWFYLYKALLPFDLRFVYPRWEADISNPLAYLPLLLFILAIAGLWIMRSRRWSRATLTALLIYVAMLFPILGFFDIFFMLYSLVADHWQYVGMPAIITLTAAGGTHLFNTPTPPHSHTPILRSICQPRIGIALSVLLCATLATLTWRQQAMYKDEETLYRSIIAKDPNCWIAQNNLGAWYYARDRKDEALEQWRTTIRIKPDHPEAHNNIGRVLSERGDDSADPAERLRLHREALTWCREALKHRPHWGAVHWNVARLLTKTGGDLRLAEQHFLEGLKKKPADDNALYDLAVALGQQGRYTEALVYFDRCLQVNPQRAEAHHGLAAVLIQLARTEEALPHLRRSVEIKTDLVEGHTDLGNLYFNRGQYEQAAKHYERALEKRPGFLNALNNLAITYGELGRITEALDQAKKALAVAEANGDATVATSLRPLIENYRQTLQERDVTP